MTETISITDEGQPRPKYIFNKCGTNIYFFTLQKFGPSPSPKCKINVKGAATLQSIPDLKIDSTFHSSQDLCILWCICLPISLQGNSNYRIQVFNQGNIFTTCDIALSGAYTDILTFTFVYIPGWGGVYIMPPHILL